MQRTGRGSHQVALVVLLGKGHRLSIEPPADRRALAGFVEFLRQVRDAAEDVAVHCEQFTDLDGRATVMTTEIEPNTVWQVHEAIPGRRPKAVEGLAAMVNFHQENAQLYRQAVPSFSASYWVDRELYLAECVIKRMGGVDGAADQEG
jgi:hypothetical protein